MKCLEGCERDVVRTHKTIIRNHLILAETTQISPSALASLRKLEVIFRCFELASINRWNRLHILFCQSVHSGVPL